MNDPFRDIDAIVFDLDGTLADTFEDLRGAVNHVRAVRGLQPLPLDAVMAHVGRGVANLVRGTLDAGEGADPEADVRAFQAWYGLHLLDATRAYPGAVEAVAALSGFRRAVLSNKPETMTRAIVAGLGFAPYLDGAWGGDSFAAMKPDPAALLAVLDRLGAEPSRALMVGDSDIDIETARRAGVRSVRVRTGLWRASAGRPDAEVQDLLELARRLDSAPVE